MMKQSRTARTGKKQWLMVIMAAATFSVSDPALAKNNTEEVLGDGYRADRVPSNDSGRIFRKGAAAANDSIVPSSFSDTFRVGANLRAGYEFNCGDLNFYNNLKAELKHLQHKLTKVVKDAQKALMASVSGAISSFFQYALMKINPTLGQLTTKHLDEYIEAFELRVKQCRDYERDVANGKNPLGEIMQIAVADQWKQSIGFVANGEKALEEAEAELIKEASKKGVQLADGKRYGGENQEPINLTKSLIKVGMNLALGNEDTANWDGGFSGDAKDHPILKEFEKPEDLYKFVEEIYGAVEKKLNVDAVGSEEANTIAGRGYELKYVEYRNDYLKDLKDLVNGRMDLKAFTEKTGDIIPPAELNDLRLAPPYELAVELEERAQNYGINRMRRNLIFARQALKTGINSPDLTQSGMRKPAEDEYKSLYYRMSDDIREIGQRAYQY